MYSLSDESEDFYCFIVCECGRKYKAEEMYVCYK